MDQLQAEIEARELRVAALLAATPVVTIAFTDARRKAQTIEYRVWRRSDLTDHQIENLTEVGAVGFSATVWKDADFEEDFEPEAKAAQAAGVKRNEAFVLLRRNAPLASWAVVSQPEW